MIEYPEPDFLPLSAIRIIGSSDDQPPKSPLDPFFDEVRRIVREEIALSKGNGVSQLLTAQQLALALEVKDTWVYEQSRLGNIPTHRIGRRYIRFDLNEVIEAQKKNQETL